MFFSKIYDNNFDKSSIFFNDRYAIEKSFKNKSYPRSTAMVAPKRVSALCQSVSCTWTTNLFVYYRNDLSVREHIACRSDQTELLKILRGFQGHSCSLYPMWLHTWLHGNYCRRRRVFFPENLPRFRVVSIIMRDAEGAFSKYDFPRNGKRQPRTRSTMLRHFFFFVNTR